MIMMPAQHFSAWPRFCDTTDAKEAQSTINVVSQRIPSVQMRVRYFRKSSSIFFDDVYIIKGVAGAILWRMLKENQTQNRTEFSNRELRLDPDIGLPEIVANLESRLILLRKRLDELSMGIVLHKLGRGRLSLVVDKLLHLEEPETIRLP